MSKIILMELAKRWAKILWASVKAHKLFKSEKLKHLEKNIHKKRWKFERFYQIKFNI